MDGLDITEDNVTNFLEREAVNGSLEAFDVDKTQFRSTHKVVGKLNLVFTSNAVLRLSATTNRGANRRL